MGVGASLFYSELQIISICVQQSGMKRYAAILKNQICHLVAEAMLKKLVSVVFLVRIPLPLLFFFRCQLFAVMSEHVVDMIYFL